jgi:small-conductance mechanosensitive channel
VWTFFAATLWALLKVLGWFQRLLEGWVTRFTEGRSLKGFHLLLWERGRLVLMTIVRVIAGISILFEFSFLLSYTFGLYPQTSGISTTLMDHLGSAFASVGLAIVNYLPSGGFILVVAFLTRYLLRALRVLANAIETGDLPITAIHPEMAKPTYQLVRLVVVIFAVVVAFPYLPGGQSEAFKGISIFLGLLLSLGSSSAVSNVLAGLVLTYMRAFRPGDRVKIADTVGDVLEKNMLVTRVLTIKNVEVVIPNSAILSNQILNYSVLARSRGLILNTTVTIGYDAPWRTVHDLLIQAALRTEGVLPTPAPFVLETSLNDFHISYELNAYTDRANEIQNTYSYLHQAIQDSFNEAGVEIMSPTFYALRDGNTVTIPESHRPADYEPPSFRVKAEPAVEHQSLLRRHQAQASDS